MKAKEIRVGGTYLAKVNERVVPVRVDAVKGPTGPYDVTNLKTGRKTTFRSAAKFRDPVPVCDKCHKPFTRFRGDKPNTCLTCLGEGDRSSVSALNDPKQEAEQRPDPTLTSTGGLSSSAEPSNATSAAAPTPTGAALQTTEEGEQSAPFARTATFNPTLSPAAVGANGAALTERVSRAEIDAALTVAELESAEPVPDSLRGDQAAAFRVVTNRILAKKKYTKLVGYAGTGKTYLLGHLAKWAKGRGFDVIVAAPTHKAAGVIEEKLEQFGAAGITVRTIHSLLGLRLEPDFENDTGGRILQADGKNKINGGLVICDEASMVGSELKKHIELVPNVRWLFVGDLAQLPPVGEEISELLNDPNAVLEKVLRQADGSEILGLATAIRGGDVSMRFQPDKDVFRVDTAEDLFQAAYRRFDSGEYRKDAAHARVLVFKNARRTAINSWMRSLLINSPDPFTPGEWLVMYAAFGPEKSRLNLMSEAAKQHQKGTYESKSAWRNFFNYKEKLGENLTQLHVSEEVLIQEVREARVAVGQNAFDIWRLTVDVRGGGQHELPVLKPHEIARVATIKEQLREEAIQARNDQAEFEPHSPGWFEADDRRKQAWSSFFTLDESFAEVDYAYAMTVHKSQGSTFDHAFVDVPDLLTSGDMSQRILYTAVTRPSKSLTFYV